MTTDPVCKIASICKGFVSITTVYLAKNQRSYETHYLSALISHLVLNNNNNNCDKCTNNCDKCTNDCNKCINDDYKLHSCGIKTNILENVFAAKFMFDSQSNKITQLPHNNSCKNPKLM